MSNDGPASPSNAPPRRPPVYRGKPENKKDPAATQGKPLGKPKKTTPKERQLQQAGDTLARPTNRTAPSEKAHSQLKDGPPHSDSIFSFNFSFEEDNLERKFMPNCAGIIALAKAMYARYSSSSGAPDLQKKLLPEALNYYATALLWMRMISIRNANTEATDHVEDQFFNKIASQSWSVPEPLLIYLQGLGNIRTLGGIHLYATFPTLPTSLSGNFGGYYAPQPTAATPNPKAAITVETHDLYEEIPCLGVTAEAIRHSLTNATGDYKSSLETDDITVTESLLGYQPLVSRRNEAKQAIELAGITTAKFPENIKGTGINTRLLRSISNTLEGFTTFSTRSVNFSTMDPSGSLSQIIVTKPNPEALIPNVDTEVKPTCAENLPASQIGMAVVFGYHLLKEGTIASEQIDNWCCAKNKPNKHLIDNTWYQNRNARRELPRRGACDQARYRHRYLASAYDRQTPATGCQRLWSLQDVPACPAE